MGARAMRLDRVMDQSLRQFLTDSFYHLFLLVEAFLLPQAMD
jgi:hypothetical protein